MAINMFYMFAMIIEEVKLKKFNEIALQHLVGRKGRSDVWGGKQQR